MAAWKMETAKARLSEVVRQAKNEGPQTITVRGQDAVVVISAEQYRRLTKAPAGEHWVDRIRREVGPIDFEFESDGGVMRDLDL